MSFEIGESKSSNRQRSTTIFEQRTNLIVWSYLVNFNKQRMIK